MNDLLHVVFHAPGMGWNESVKTMFMMAGQSGVWKENIDGEALAWAVELTGCQQLIYLHDGLPMDDSTLCQNPITYLENHKNQVLNDMKTKGVDVVSVFIDKNNPFLETIATSVFDGVRSAPGLSETPSF